MASMWMNAKAWPVDMPGHLFLARAVMMVGKARFGDQWSWTGREPGLHDLLGELCAFTGDLRFCAMLQETREAIARFYDIQQWIGERCLHGQIKSATRAPEGGKLTPLDPSVWATENLRVRFIRCTIDPLDPFGPFSRQRRLIYLEAAGLQNALAPDRMDSLLVATAPATSRRRGRRPKYDWGEVELFLTALCASRGDPEEPCQVDNWQSQADAERAVSDFLSRGGAEPPAESVVRENVSRMLAGWRLKRAEN